MKTAYNYLYHWNTCQSFTITILYLLFIRSVDCDSLYFTIGIYYGITILNYAPYFYEYITIDWPNLFWNLTMQTLLLLVCWLYYKQTSIPVYLDFTFDNWESAKMIFVAYWFNFKGFMIGKLCCFCIRKGQEKRMSLQQQEIVNRIEAENGNYVKVDDDEDDKRLIN